jgi:hypothetical protein
MLYRENDRANFFQEIAQLTGKESFNEVATGNEMAVSLR